MLYPVRELKKLKWGLMKKSSRFLPTTTQSAAHVKETVFIEGNRIRRPDTQQLSNKAPTAASFDERTTTIGVNNSNVLAISRQIIVTTSSNLHSSVPSNTLMFCKGP